MEPAKCRTSILMHNADKWVAGDQLTQGYSLVERVTATVHRICGSMINVVDCFAVGGFQCGVLPSSVYLSFGSAQQKSTFFRIMKTGSDLETRQPRTSGFWHAGTPSQRTIYRRRRS